MTLETARKILEQIRKDYNTIAGEFSATRFSTSEEGDFLKGLVQPGNKVLDVGCGNGRLYESFKDQNVSYLGIDSSEKLIELAQEKWDGSHGAMIETLIHDREKVPQRGPQFEVGDILTLQYRDEFDLLLCIRVLPHIPSVALRQQAVDNLYKALKPGGTLVLTAWNLWQPKWWKLHFQRPRDLDFDDLLIPWKGSAAPAVQAYRYYHAFTLRELRRLLQKSGFQIQQAYYGKRGEKKSWWQWNNLVVVAKK